MVRVENHDGYKVKIIERTSEQISTINTSYLEKELNVDLLRYRMIIKSCIRPEEEK